MAQTLVRTLVRDFNADLINREIKAAFPAKFTQGDATLPGYEVDLAQFTTGSGIQGRIFTPTAQAVVITTINGVPSDTAQPGEIRMSFNPNLTAGQVTNLDDTVLVDHVVTDTTPKQAAEDQDEQALADIEAFDAGDAWNLRTALEQNQHMVDINRMVLRIWDKLEAAE